jgi:hypothetical protein
MELASFPSRTSENNFHPLLVVPSKVQVRGQFGEWGEQGDQKHRYIDQQGCPGPFCAQLLGLPNKVNESPQQDGQKGAAQSQFKNRL